MQILKSLISLGFAISFMGLWGCALGTTDEKVAMKTKEPTEKTTAQMNIGHSNGTAHNMANEENMPKIMWVKRINAPVYDNEKAVIGTLNASPVVDVFEIDDEWVLIDLEVRKWAKLSDLSMERPDKLEISAGEPRTGLETLDRDEILEAVKTGKRPTTKD